jgi:hypothetical protein
MGSENSTPPDKQSSHPCLAADDLPALNQVALQTERLLLRPLRDTDAPSLLLCDSARPVTLRTESTTAR